MGHPHSRVIKGGAPGACGQSIALEMQLPEIPNNWIHKQKDDRDPIVTDVGNFDAHHITAQESVDLLPKSNPHYQGTEIKDWKYQYPK